MYVKDKMIRHELTKIEHILQNDPAIIADARSKINLMRDLEIINENQYAFEMERLDIISK